MAATARLPERRAKALPDGLGLQIKGIMAKRRDSNYQLGVRSPDWLKVKRHGWNEGRMWAG